MSPPSQSHNCTRRNHQPCDSELLLKRCRYVTLALPAIVHTVFFNRHMSIEMVDASLRTQNWTLLDRQWSNTGYISVLESKNENYRVLRADHSLLGTSTSDKRRMLRNEATSADDPLSQAANGS